jgi:hypothetical protein
MIRHEVSFRASESGTTKHIVKAKDRDEAKEKVERAYPDQKIVFYKVERMIGA